MKTLILNGSPRLNGDTVSLIRCVTEGLKGEYRIVDAYRCAVSPCVDCRYCWEHSACAISDQMEDIYREIETCDNLLIASPVYFSELTGKLLDLCSRLQYYFGLRYVQKQPSPIREKRGAVLLVGGGQGSIERAAETARLLLTQMRCRELHPLVSSHNTDHVPASEDEAARQGAASIAAFFNR